MARKVNVGTYARNVTRSAGYIASKAIKGVNPTLTGYISENADAAKEMYQSVRDFKRNFRAKSKDFLDSEYGKLGRQAVGNAISDLKTGKFYNPERMKAGEEAMMKSMGFDFSDDFDWDKFDDDLANEGSPSDVTNDTVQSVGNQISSTTSVSISSSTDRLTRVGKINTRATLKQIEYSTGVINNSLAAINSSLLSFHRDIAEPLANHIQNSTNFYTTATDELAKQTALLQNIYNMMEERYNPKKKSGFGSYKSSPWDDVFGNGLPNFRAWGSQIKNKAKSADMGMSSMILSMLDGDMVKSMLQGSEAMNSPISFLLASALSAGLANTRHGRSFNRLNDTIASAFAHGMSRVHYTAKHGTGLKSILASLLDITPKANNKFNTKYDTGRVDWTGMDAKALREVIPTQLAQILSALTGEEPKVFNYNTGKWSTASNAFRAFEKSRRSSVISAGSGLKTDMTKAFSDMYGINTYTNAAQGFGRDFDNLMQYIGTHNVDLASDINTLRDVLKAEGMMGQSSASRRYPIDERNFNRIISIMKKRPEFRTRFTASGYAARNANNRFMENAGSDNSGIIALRNGSGLYRNRGAGGASNNILTSMVDNKGNNIFFYLQNYYSELKRISAALSNGRGGTPAAMSRSIHGGYDFEVPDNSTFGARNSISTPFGVDNRFYRRGGIATAGSYYDTGEYYDPSSKEGGKKATNKKDREKIDYDEKLANSSWYQKGKKIYNKYFKRDGEAPTFIDRLGQGLSSLIIGDENDPELFKEGIFGLLKNLPSRLGTVLKDAIMDPIKELMKDLLTKGRDKLAGWWGNVKNSEGYKRFTSSIKNSSLGFIGDAFSSTYKNIKSGFAATMGDDGSINTTGQNSRGGHVLRSGVVSVSEGEYIVPAERNPFYKGHMTSSQRYNVEARNAAGWLLEGNDYDDFWGMYKKGGNVRRRKRRRGKKKYKSKTFSAISGAAKFGKGAVEKAVEFGKEEAQNIAEDINDMAESNETIQEATSTLSKAIGGFSRVISAGAVKFFGEDTIQGSKQAAKGITGLIKPYLPETLAGGTLGALIGAAATGSGLGLLGGFVIGGGVSLINRSEVLQKTIFGEEDEVGNYRGGMLNSKVATFLKKRFPRMAKSGAVGSVLGMLGIAPGGLLGGFALGAGLDLLSGTDQFKDFLFGHKGVDGKRRGGMLGSLQVRVVDPLANYVQNGLKNLDKYLKEKFLDPIAKLGTSLFDWTRGVIGAAAKALFGGISDKVVKPLANRLDRILGVPIGAVRKLGGAAIGAGKWLVERPFAVAGAAGNALERYNIRKGYTHLNAAQRLAIGNTRGKDEKSDLYTEWAATASAADIQDALLYSSNNEENRKKVQQLRQEMNDTLIASLNQGGMGTTERKTVSQLKRLMNSKDVRVNGDPTAIYNWIQSQVSSGNMSPENGQKAIDYVQEQMSRLAKVDADNKDYEKNREAWRKKQKAEGRSFLVDPSNTIKRLMGVDLKDAKKRESGEHEKEIDERNKIRETFEQDPVKKMEFQNISDIKTGVEGIFKHLTGKDLPKSDKTDPTKPAKNVKLNIPGTKEKSEDDEKSEQWVNGPNGTPIKLVKNANGDMSPDMRDSQTNNAIDDANEDRHLKNRFYNAFLGESGFISSFKNFIGLSKNKNKDEDKETLWDKITKIGSGIISGITGFFTGGGIFSLINKIATGISKIAGWGATIAGLGLGISGLYSLATNWQNGPGAVLEHSTDLMDSAEAAIRGDERVEYNENEYQTDRISKNIIERNIKNALGANMKGPVGKVGKAVNTVAKKGANAVLHGGSKTAAKFAANHMIKNADGTTALFFGNKLIEASGSTSQKVLNTIGKSVDDVAEMGVVRAAGKGTAEVMKAAANKVIEKTGNSATVKKIIEVVSDGLKWVIKKLGKDPDTVIKGLNGVLQSGAEKLAKSSIVRGAKTAGKTAAKVIPFIGQVIAVGSIVLAVEQGWEDAGANFGILGEPTTAMRIVSALVAGLNEFFLGLFNTEDILNFGITIAEALGYDFGDLSDRRAEAQAELDAYNASVEPDKRYNNVKDYRKNVLHDYTTQDKIVNFGKATIGKAVDFGKGIVKQAGGLAGTAKSYFSGKLGSTAIDSLKANEDSKVGQFLSKNENISKIAAGGLNAISNPIGFIRTAGSAILHPGETLSTIGGAFKEAGNAIFGTEVGKNIKEAATAIIKIPGDVEAAMRNTSADGSAFSRAADVKINISEDNPLSGVTNAIGGVVKTVSVPIAMIKAVGTIINGKIIQPVIKAAKDTVNDAINTVQQNVALATAGSITDLVTSGSVIGDNSSGLGFVAGAANVISKVLLTPVAGVMWLGNKVSGFFNDHVKGPLSVAGNAIAKSYDMAKGFSDKHDIVGLLTFDSSDGEELSGPLGFLSTTSDNIYKMVFAVPTAFNALGDKVMGFFSKAKSAFDIGDTIDKLWEYTDTKKHPTMEGYDDIVNAEKSTEEGIFGGIDRVVATLTGTALKGIISLVRPFVTIKNKIGGWADWVMESINKVIGWFTGGVSDATDSLMEEANKYDDQSGSGSGVHVSQKDSRYAGKRFGKTTIGKNGCGPAAAATVLRAYGRDANLSDVADYAQANGFVAGSSGVGTKAGYFKSILGRNGISSRYTTNRGIISNAVGSGNPTILLGQDKSNRSKSNSPFGPNPHYVVAQGRDANGNIVIDDPELNGPAIYNKNILNNTKLGIMTGGDSSLPSLEELSSRSSSITKANVGKSITGTNLTPSSNQTVTSKGINTTKTTSNSTSTNGNTIDTSTPQGYTFNFFRNNGFSDAATAGIMGNIEQESGFDPARRQNGGGPAAGLFQWENANKKTKRWASLDAYAKQKGTDWTDLQTQLEYALTEMGTTENWAWSHYKDKSGISTLDEFKKMTNPEDAANAFMVSFERPNAAKSGIDNRKAAAVKYYNQYTGSNLVPVASSTGFGNTTSTSGSSSSSSSSGLSGLIDNIFGAMFNSILPKLTGAAGQIFGLIFGGNDSSGSSSSTLTSNGLVGSAGVDTENKFVNTMNSIMGKNEYSMDSSLRERVFDTIDKGASKGYGDCSATVRKVIQRVSGINIGGNTQDQYENYASRGGEIVLDTNGAGARKQGTVDITKLRPGDAMYYSRPDSSYTQGRPDRIGHVEMYMGNGMRAGHGSGMGPKITSATDDQERFLRAIRFVHDDFGNDNATSGESSAALSDADQMVAAGSGLPLYDFTKMKSSYPSRQMRRSNRPTKRGNYTGGASGVTVLDSGLSEKLDQILAVLKQIMANSYNSAYLPAILEVIKAYGNTLSKVNNSDYSAASREAINQDISAMMSKLDTITASL